MERNETELEQIVKERLSPRRAQHTLQCAACARLLAQRFGADASAAYLAGLLHDITKELSVENQLKLCEKHGIILDNVSRENPALLHAITGAIVAKEEFSAPEHVCRAIRYHTTGCEYMSALDQCVWLADMIEPGREFRGVSELRRMAKRDLALAVFTGMDQTMMHLIAKKKVIHPDMLAARNQLLRERTTEK